MQQRFESIDVDYCNWDAYSLIDSGNGQKLERFGPVTVVRGEPKAWWAPTLPASEWRKASAVHDDDTKKWIFRGDVPKEWCMPFEGLQFSAKFFNTSKHVGVFPEQAAHWRWMQQLPRKPVNVLSLFGYTGTATLVAAKLGASVTHVDASKPAIAWARANQSLSGMDMHPIRWILEDAKKFVKRELKRERTYDMIILDPPSFGRGPDGQAWHIEKDLVPLLEDCAQLLSPQPSGMIMTLYALEASPLMLGHLLQDMMKGHGGRMTVGELAHQPKHGNKVLPLSLYARWAPL